MLNPSGTGVFLAPGVTDLRKSIDGLSILVENHFDADLFSGGVFGFCNRSRDRVKLLYWDRNGFCLWLKRLEKEKFRWPESGEEEAVLTQRELQWLLEGLDYCNLTPHSPLKYESVF